MSRFKVSLYIVASILVGGSRFSDGCAVYANLADPGQNAPVVVAPSGPSLTPTEMEYVRSLAEKAMNWGPRNATIQFNQILNDYARRMSPEQLYEITMAAATRAGRWAASPQAGFDFASVLENHTAGRLYPDDLAQLKGMVMNSNQWSRGWRAEFERLTALWRPGSARPVPPPAPMASSGEISAPPPKSLNGSEMIGVRESLRKALRREFASTRIQSVTQLLQSNASRMSSEQLYEVCHTAVQAAGRWEFKSNSNNLFGVVVAQTNGRLSPEHLSRLKAAMVEAIGRYEFADSRQDGMAVVDSSWEPAK